VTRRRSFKCNPLFKF